MNYIDDEFIIRAKKEGYLARSVYKIKEIDKKISLFSKGNVLDIGAAPGSFSQYAYKKLNRGILVSVDLIDISFNFDKNFNFIKGDVFNEDTFNKIKEFAPYSLLISDAAPRTTGDRLIDTSNSFNLNMRIYELALKLLKKGGSFLIKVFQGGDELEIFSKFKQNFSIAKKFRPKAVRKNSFEVYFVGKGFLKR